MKIFIFKSLAILFFILSLLCDLKAQILHRDLIADFEISGKVFDNDTKEPILGAIVIFYDLSLARGVSEEKERYEIKLTSTNKNGIFNVSFKYWWGENEKISGIETNVYSPNREFEIVIYATGYQETGLIYNLDKIQIERLVKPDIGNIYLTKGQESIDIEKISFITPRKEDYTEEELFKMFVAKKNQETVRNILLIIFAIVVIAFIIYKKWHREEKECGHPQ